MIAGRPACFSLAKDVVSCGILALSCGLRVRGCSWETRATSPEFHEQEILPGWDRFESDIMDYVKVALRIEMLLSTMRLV